MREFAEAFVVSTMCRMCQGDRVGDIARSVLIQAKNISQITRLSVEHSIDFFDKLSLTSEQSQIAQNVLKNIRDRLRFLKGVGLGYMTLARRSNTLSG